MSKYIGRLVNVGLAKEASRGVAVAASYWLPKTSIAFFDRVTKITSKMNYGVIGDAAQAYKANEWSEGTMETEFNDRAMGLLLLGVFGTETPTGPSDSAYTHTYSIANTAQHQSLTLTIADPDRTDQFALTCVDSMEISLKPDEVVMANFAFKGHTGRQIAAASPSYSTAFNKFLGRHATIKLATVVGGLTAASALALKSFKIKINKNLILNSTIGTVWPDDILNQKFEITGEFELDLDDQTYRQLMLDGSYRALRFQLTNTDVLIGTSSRPDFKLDLARCHFEAWEAVRPNDGLVTQKISFRALYDATTGTIVNSCTLINAVASY